MFPNPNGPELKNAHSDFGLEYMFGGSFGDAFLSEKQLIHIAQKCRSENGPSVIINSPFLLSLRRARDAANWRRASCGICRGLLWEMHGPLAGDAANGIWNTMWESGGSLGDAPHSG